MKVICSACGKYLGDKPSDVFGPDTISHGLCHPCAIRFQAEVGVPLDEYLESLPAPTVVVTQEGTVNGANSSALSLLRKSPAQIQGNRGGDVFECRHARLPEGCGNTVHCSGCTIRQTVMDTMQTGEPHREVLAYLNRALDEHITQVELLISTAKRDGIIFLQIDYMAPTTSSNAP